MDADLGRFIKETGRPNNADILHLGRQGLNMFSAHIKRCLFFKAANQSSEKFKASGGNYADAAGVRASRGGGTHGS